MFHGTRSETSAQSTGASAAWWPGSRIPEKRGPRPGAEAGAHRLTGRSAINAQVGHRLVRGAAAHRGRSVGDRCPSLAGRYTSGGVGGSGREGAARAGLHLPRAGGAPWVVTGVKAGTLCSGAPPPGPTERLTPPARTHAVEVRLTRQKMPRGCYCLETGP